MKFKIDVHTIVILVGPDQSGKSAWASIFKNKINKLDQDLKVSILSFDNINSDLCNGNIDKYSPEVLQSSNTAKNTLLAQIKEITQFPFNHDFVVIDSVGLDDDFRKKIQSHAKEFNYRTAIVVFDYNKVEYLTNVQDLNIKNIIEKDVNSFKKSFLPTFKRKSYNYFLIIKEKSISKWEHIEVEIGNYDIWRKCYFTDNVFDTKCDIMIIGDIHENMTPLMTILEKNPGKKVFFVGDIIDKGSNTKEAINKTIELMKNGAILVRGNHESFVARRIKGEVEKLHNENDLFPALEIIMQDDKLKEDFMWLYNESLPFACIKTHGKTIYITHAPCYNKYLGKIDSVSQKFQRNFYFSSRDKNAMEKDLEFVKEEADTSHPLHAFGHVAHCMKNVEYKNKIWMDTGSVYGNELTALIIDKEGNKTYIKEKTHVIFNGHLFFNKKNTTPRI